ALGNINLLLRRDDLEEKMRRRLTVAEREMKKIGQIVIRLAELAPPQEAPRKKFTTVRNQLHTEPRFRPGKAAHVSWHVRCSRRCGPSGSGAGYARPEPLARRACGLVPPPERENAQWYRCVRPLHLARFSASLSSRSFPRPRIRDSFSARS